jgi:hypothetical protein
MELKQKKIAVTDGCGYDNLMMRELLMEHARLAHVEKFVAIGTVCSHPTLVPVRFGIRASTDWNRACARQSNGFFPNPT